MIQSLEIIELELVSKHYERERLTLYTATVVLIRLTLVDKESLVQVLGTQLKRFLNILRTADQAAPLFLVEVLKVK